MWHINDDDELRKCSAQTPDSCDFRGKPHGELAVMGRIAEQEAERSILAERRLAKQAQRVSGVKNHRRNLSEQTENATAKEPESPDTLRIPNSRPTPSDRRRIAREQVQKEKSQAENTPKPRPIPKPSPRPMPSPPRMNTAKTLPSVADVSATELLPGDVRVTGVQGKTYIIPKLMNRQPESEEDFLVEIEKQRLFLNRARYVTEREEELARSNISYARRGELEREKERECVAAERAGVPWDVPVVMEMWDEMCEQAERQGARAHWARLTKGQRQLAYHQMTEEDISNFRALVSRVDLAKLEPSVHVREKLASGRLSRLEAEDIAETLDSYRVEAYQVTQSSPHKPASRAVTIRSKNYSQSVVLDRGMEPVEANLVLVISLDPPNKDKIVTAYWRAVNSFPSKNSARYQDRWLRVPEPPTE